MKLIIRLSAAKSATFPLYLRIPEWCSNAKVYVNNELLQHKHKALSYTKIERTWNNNDVVKIVLPKKVTIKEWDKNKNSVSVNYGPLTFSLKIREDYKQMDSKASAIGDSKWQANVDESKWPSFEIYPAGNWNYGLLQSEVNNASMFEVLKKQWPADDFPFTQQSVPLEIKAKGKQIPSWQVDKYGLCDTLPQSPVAVKTNTEVITLIPMGAARLRISAFPVVQRQLIINE